MTQLALPLASITDDCFRGQDSARYVCLKVRNTSETTIEVTATIPNVHMVMMATRGIAKN